MKKLPSTRSVRLAHHVRQEINRVVNQFYADHTGYLVTGRELK